MARFSFSLLAVLLSASSALASSNHPIRHEVHSKLAHVHASENLTDRSVASQKDWKLHKRFDNARFTNYEAGLGACGNTNGDGDSIVALNAAQYGGGEHCGQTITITVNGKSKQATIEDKCPGCPFGALDLTPSLFSFFAPLDQGTLYGSWAFGNGDPSPSPSPTSTKHRSTSSTPSPTSTSFSSTSTSSSIVSSSTSISSTSTSSEAPTPTVDSSSFVDVLDYGVVQLGGIIAGAAQVNLQTSNDS
ncbi:uncharacterized protein FOMMEDRAFT_167222 [Fomitiporia mediterranea MF3/22]|uniref:uncharacterized protein n=1 Tax=Fomitiporia mediterranea (strain MF3/22) TaxID=694068 RepID=UPI00044079C5|nr:uncharacterized protein FOMMEDRAFT_167222 [Fomitiporia mediterranea MF3/22]EJD03918.1 hypothetical protein FOMMEDRAFT_167222 [Fomitiporia mediterranea MF3/22]